MSIERNPPWTSDEIILALDLYRRTYPSIPGKTSSEVVQLSETLRHLKALMGETPSADYRNANGVYMKLMNFHHINPNHEGSGLAGGSRLDRELFNRYWNDAPTLNNIAEKILSGISANVDVPRYDEQEDEELEPQEGRFLVRIHRSRERNRKIVERKKAHALKEHGVLECECCGFDFAQTYGERGHGYIECHHKKPVSEIEVGQPTRLDDLALVCSNCHRMIHRTRPWLTISQLNTLVRGKG